MNIIITEEQYRRIQSLKEDKVLYHVSEKHYGIDKFTRTGLWLSDFPDESYGDLVYMYKIPDSLKIADEQTTVEFIKKYNEQDLINAAQNAGDDIYDEDFDPADGAKDILINPEGFMTEGEWAYMLQQAGYDGFWFDYNSMDCYTYYYLFDPKSATLINPEPHEFDPDNRDYNNGGELHEGQQLNGDDRLDLINYVLENLKFDDDKVVAVSKVQTSGRFKGYTRVQITGEETGIDSLGLINKGGVFVLTLADLQDYNGNHAVVEMDDQDTYQPVLEFLNETMREYGHLD